MTIWQYGTQRHGRSSSSKLGRHAHVEGPAAIALERLAKTDPVSVLKPAIAAALPTSTAQQVNVAARAVKYQESLHYQAPFRLEGKVSENTITETFQVHI
eukprot:CAMPEP_0113906398 /NCGR_PEP_ID=MMETSP0780_2-20120614/24719_1 /TAXON_ID=652834 /ORGANISM="Palpitomonas bilix" /LENGTH=99 /DNA_ID=CAMNT_0000900981 /DNA_START=352 /DNA_END=651 /DNA_ORIENTATION=- /assembly_acc=CAM_ASM_000599